PIMGYSGATWMIQEVCNGMFDALFNIIPLSTDLDHVDATPARLKRDMAWAAAAQAELDDLISREPVLVRISTAKRLRDAAETIAHSENSSTVKPEQVRRAHQQLSSVRAA
ncbi:MAG: chlorophyllide reductase subunit Z, partial [Pseudomonadota bacterium]